MFKYDLNDIILIKNPIEISGTIIKRHIIFNKNGVSKISYDIKTIIDENIILNILEEDIIGQHKFDKLNILFQFKYKIGDTVYTLKNSYKIEYIKGLIIEQRYSESDTKINYKYKIAIDGEFLIVEEKYLIDKSEKDLLIKKQEEPIIEPKKIKTDLIISSKKKQKSFQDIDNKLNIIIEKIDYLDNKITNIENNFQENLDDIKNDIEDNNNLCETINQNIDENNSILNSIYNINIKTKLVSQSDIENQFKELKDYLDNKITDIDTSLLELHKRTII
jgi:hypothetical protein